MNIKQLQKLCHKISKQKGFWDWARNDGELISLMHSELSEALEVLRKGYILDLNKLGEELADCVIRIMDYCEARGIDLQTSIEKKIRKNKKRAHKHGKKF